MEGKCPVGIYRYFHRICHHRLYRRPFIKPRDGCPGIGQRCYFGMDLLAVAHYTYLPAVPNTFDSRGMDFWSI